MQRLERRIRRRPGRHGDDVGPEVAQVTKGDEIVGADREGAQLDAVGCAIRDVARTLRHQQSHPPPAGIGRLRKGGDDHRLQPVQTVRAHEQCDGEERILLWSPRRPLVLDHVRHRERQGGDLIVQPLSTQALGQGFAAGQHACDPPHRGPQRLDREPGRLHHVELRARRHERQVLVQVEKDREAELAGDADPFVCADQIPGDDERIRLGELDDRMVIALEHADMHTGDIAETLEHELDGNVHGVGDHDDAGHPSGWRSGRLRWPHPRSRRDVRRHELLDPGPGATGFERPRLEDVDVLVVLGAEDAVAHLAHPVVRDPGLEGIGLPEGVVRRHPVLLDHVHVDEPDREVASDPFPQVVIAQPGERDVRVVETHHLEDRLRHDHRAVRDHVEQQEPGFHGVLPEVVAPDPTVALPCEHRRVAGDHAARMTVGLVDQALERIGVQHIVVEGEPDELAAGEPVSLIAGDCGQPDVAVVPEHAHPRVTQHGARDDLRCRVGAAVIDDDDLEVAEGLGQHRVERALQHPVVATPEGRQDVAHPWWCGALASGARSEPAVPHELADLHVVLQRMTIAPPDPVTPRSTVNPARS